MLGILNSEVMKKIILIIFLLSTVTSFGCSCSQLRLTNAFSGIEFIGIIKFTSLKKVSDFEEFYKVEYEVIEQFVGNKKTELFIESQESSSCSFIPEINFEYFILAYKNENGFLVTSFCLAKNIPTFKVLSILREVTKANIHKNTTQNIIQYTKEKLNTNLFKKEIKGALIYEVNLNSNLEVTNLKPYNDKAKNNFNKRIKKELRDKFRYKKMNKELKIKGENFKAFIVLNWIENYKRKLVIETTKI
ncbi:conserved protein of unknown function [Tenacibaculum sp. 190524A02b]